MLRKASPALPPGTVPLVLVLVLVLVVRSMQCRSTHRGWPGPALGRAYADYRIRTYRGDNLGDNGVVEDEKDALLPLDQGEQPVDVGELPAKIAVGDRRTGNAVEGDSGEVAEESLPLG